MSPAIRYLTRAKNIVTTGGITFYPHMAMSAMGSLRKGDGSLAVTDYLVQPDPNDSNLEVYVEGSALLREISEALMAHSESLGGGVYTKMLGLTIRRVEPGVLNQARNRMSMQRGGASGPTKHQVLNERLYDLSDHVIEELPVGLV